MVRDSIAASEVAGSVPDSRHCQQAVEKCFKAFLTWDDVPPETASTLAALFSGMAQLLQAAAAPPMTPGGTG
jgi:HEPN domain